MPEPDSGLIARHEVEGRRDFDLATITRNTVMPRLPGAETFQVTTQPTPLQKKTWIISACACSVPSSDTLDSIERQYIQNVTLKCGWNFALSAGT
ncbi:MAG: hypothetical protein OXQ84_04375 [bacterium]|nr:hypothetical protein [bacterium]